MSEEWRCFPTPEWSQVAIYNKYCINNTLYLALHETQNLCNASEVRPPRPERPNPGYISPSALAFTSWFRRQSHHSPWAPQQNPINMKVKPLDFLRSCWVAPGVQSFYQPSRPSWSIIRQNWPSHRRSRPPTSRARKACCSCQQFLTYNRYYMPGFAAPCYIRVGIRR